MIPILSRKRGASLLRTVLPLAMAAVVGMCATKPAHALAPAGSTINNQAIGVYTDGSGVPQNVTSNSVQTVVQPVAGFSLSANNIKNATTGSTVSFTHTITNTGNSTDSFNLTAVDVNSGDDFNVTPIVRADANGDGIADGLLPITRTPSLAPGESYQFVVTGIALGLSGSAQVTVTGTSVFDSAEVHTNTDTVNISTNAQVNVVKSIDKASGAPGSGPYTYTLTYTNSGNTAATNLTITDVLPIGLVYVPNSGRWSGSGATALTDPAAGDPAGINYTGAVLPQTIVANIASIPAGASGRLTFQANIASGLLAGILPNTAAYTYNDGLTLLGSTPTNTVNLTVTQLTSLTYTGQVVTSANQGATVTFTNALHNTSTGSDTFNITMVPVNTFPLGTTFQFFKSDGITPLLDTNGDNIPDTGVVAAGATYNVVVKATLPSLSVGVGPYAASSVATSIISPLVFDTAIDRLDGITASTVDLTNDAAGLLGAGQGPAPSPALTPITTLTNALGGTIQNFTLFLKNTGATSDSYILTASVDGNFGVPLTLPAGVVLTFKNDAGGIVTNTGLVAPGDTVKVNANVFLPTGILPQTLRIYFRALSPLTGATDTKLDAIDIAGIRNIAVTPNGIGQVYPGNATVYTHVLKNTGALSEGGGDGVLTSKVTLTSDNTASGFTSVIYRDANNDGVLDASDPVVTDIPALSAGASMTIFVKVYAAAGTDLGTVNTTTLNATTTGGVLVPAVATLKDSTTVIAGQIRMEKTQALSTGGVLSYSVSRITTGAKPGAVIRYRIIATNVGTAPATGFVISDATPPFTAYDKGDNSLTATGNAVWTIDGTTFHAADTPLTDGSTGNLAFTIGTLNPGQSATVTFGVKIQ